MVAPCPSRDKGGPPHVGNRSGRPGVAPGMELAPALDFARTTTKGVLVTLKRDGLPQLSNILYVVDDDGTIRISITADRAKYRNLSRNSWAALHVSREDFFAYAVIEADAELSPVASDPTDATVEELIDYYRAALGEHSNWDEYRAAMVNDRRAVVRLRPRRAYGMFTLPEPD
jgi:PPOX class probable F420-dependent enzyme